MFLSITYICIVLFQGLYFGEEASKVQGEAYTLKLTHPGFKVDKPQQYKVIQGIDPSNGSFFYSMIVESVYCAEDICKVVPVRLFWDMTGKYQRYELEDDITLEKDEGVLFNDVEYNKLHEILKDTKSPFQSIEYRDLIQTTELHGIDAVTGSTLITIDENATIRGATWTCYTLWHWANGSVCDSIYKISAESVTHSQLVGLLMFSVSNYIEFALKELTNMKDYSETTVQTVTNRGNLFDHDSFTATIEYLEEGPDEVYLESVFYLFRNGQSEQQREILNSLHSSSCLIPIAYLDDLALCLADINDYQEIDLMLQLFDKLSLSTSISNQQVLLLLNRDILVARRAYWYLNDRELSSTQQKKIKRYRKENAQFL